MSRQSTLTRRSALQGITAAGVVMSSVALAQEPATAHDATPTATTPHPIVGAWRIIPDQPGPALVLIIYHADGTLLFSTPASSPADPGAAHAVTLETPAYGAWEATDARSAALSATLMDTDETGAFLGTLNFHGTAQLDETQDAYTYTGMVEVVNPDGSVAATFPASTRATRIRVDRDRTAATPPVGTPTP